MAKTKAGGAAPRLHAFDAGQSGRRLRSLPTSAAAINAQIRQYGKSILTRSRYLAANNPYAAAAKETFVSALVGSGIMPSPLTPDADARFALKEAWNDWTDEADADGLTDLYGMQAIIGGEMFEAGECFVRMRTRRPEDMLSVPLQLQILPAEMLPLEHNEGISGGHTIVSGIEFDAIGRRVAYHFLRQHPGENLYLGTAAGLKTIVPADEVLHLYRPMRAGQVRGLPHTLSAIVKLAVMDQYDDAELERKRTAALFSAFITKPAVDGDPMGGETQQKDGQKAAQPENTIAMEPGAAIDLEPGEDVKFAEPADVGSSYEAFQYRTLLAIAAGFGVPYAAMTGDLRQTSYGSIRAGLIEFRRRVEAIQHHVMVFQLCRPVWTRWLTEAVLAKAVPFAPAEFLKRGRELRRVKWIPPKWDWIDPLKDLQAEKLAVDNGFKARSDVIEAIGDTREATDERILADQESVDELDLRFGVPEPPTAVDPNAEQDDNADAQRAKATAELPVINVTVPITMGRKGAERTIVTKHDAQGRVLEFERSEIEDDNS